MPKVSVVIPAHNSAGFLGEALRSVFDQTFEDYEVIVVDDGSVDQTKQVIEGYGNKIKYVFQEKGGPARAKNNGIRNSVGEYVAFLDADDVWLPTKLEKQVGMFHRHPELAMVFTENFFFDESGMIDISFRKRKKLMKGDLARNIFLHDGVATPTVMVRKEVFDEIGLFEEDLRMAEDDNMWVRIATNFRVELLDEHLVRIRAHPGRATADKKRLFEAVLTNIRLLSQRYQGVKERIEDVIPRKLSEVQFSMGYDHFENQEFREARKAFLQGIRCYGWNWRNYLYFLLSLCPRRVVLGIRWFKKKVRPFRLTRKEVG